MQLDLGRDQGHPLRGRLALVAVLGLASIEAIVALSVYTHLDLILAGLAAGGATLYLVARRPAAIAYVALGWLVFEKSVEPHLPIDPTRIDSIGDVLLVVALGWILMVNLVQRREPLFTMRQMGVPLVAFTALGVVSTLVNRVPLHVAELGILSTTHSMIMFLVLVNVGIYERDIYRFVYICVGAMAVISLIALPQILPGSPAWKLAATPPLLVGSHLARVQGIFDHPIGFGDLIAMVLPLGLMLFFLGDVRGRWHMLLLAANVVMGMALILTFTREAWAAVPVSVFILGLTVERKLLRAFLRYILPTLVALALVVTPLANRLAATTQGNTRYRLLDHTLPIIKSHFWLGVGPGRFGGHVALITHTPLYAQYNMTDYFYGTGGQIDMFWTHLVTESGVLGTLAYLAAFAASFLIGRSAYRQSIDPRRRAVLLGLLFSIPVVIMVSLFSSTLEVGSLATFFWGLMGMLTVLSDTPDLAPNLGGGSS